MLIKTTRFGEVEVPEEQVMEFPIGLPGFAEEKFFVFVEFGQNSPFYFMQSTVSPDLTFIVANPRVFFPDYELHVSADALDFMEAEKEEDMAIYAILSVPDDFRLTTANLLAPILINTKLKRGLQSIPPQSPYGTRHPIFPAKPQEKMAEAR